MKKALLPTGFHDTLYPNASQKVRVQAKLSKAFEQYGYMLVDPPIMEFETSLFSGPSRILKEKAFRVMDPVSHKMMALRVDMTGQMARIAVSRLRNEIKPLRISYIGQVVRISTSTHSAQRQLTQAGIELIGEDSHEADAEIVVVATNVLKQLGLKNLAIDFTLPSVTEVILQKSKLPEKDKKRIRNALNKKDIGLLKKYASETLPILIQLSKPTITITELQKLELPKQAKTAVERLDSIINIIKEQVKGLSISIDPIENVGLGYHSDIGFSIFCTEAKGELGRGGRYTIQENKKPMAGVGFTLYIDELFSIVEKPKLPNKIYVPYGTPKKNITELHNKGMITILGRKNNANNIAEAKKQKCHAIYENGKIKKLKA